jgi:glutamate--cysteine ligase
VIAGVHFNYSIPRDFWPALQAMERDERPLQSFISESYFGMLRNLQRFGWLIPYLFGASPSVCKSFLGGRPTNLREFDENTYYSPYATSLRMGDIGYQNSKEEGTGIKACYNSLDAYVQTLSCAIETLCPIYQAIGVKVDGEYRQLNANILQIENEYYSTVRPKQVPELMEKPIHALQRRGVRYVELRSLDVNPYHPLGIAEEQIYFLEALMILSLLETSPEFDVAEQKEIDWNELAAAHRGRDPALRLKLRGDEIGLRDWGLEICDAMEPIVELLDDAMATSPYRNSLQIQRERLEHSDMTPSAIMLAEMRERGEGFYHFAKRKSLEHYDYFMQHDHSSEDQDLLECEATDSWRRQREMEKADNLSFDQFLSNYFSQQL